MIRNTVLLSTTSLLLSLGFHASAQPIGQPSTDGTPSDAQREMHALQDMNNATADSLQQTNKRIAMMQKYLKDKGMLEDYENGMHGDTNQDGKVDSSDVPFQLTFDKALDVAEQHEVNLAREANSETPDQRRADAYRAVVKSSWDHLHEKMAEVNSMSDYLSKKGKFGDYKEWAIDQNAADQKAYDDKYAAKSKAAEDAQEAQDKKANKQLLAREAELQKQHEKFLQTSWDHYKFNQEEYTKRYKYSQKYRNGNFNGYGDGGYYGGGW
ncbi:MAG: hypothetical protein VX527_10635 [Planctomycetota bacterium]|nr:hypothetical protein [Planctomycetota bacterium]